MVFLMNVTIKTLDGNSQQIEDVQKFLFKKKKKEFGYDYVPQWHQDIVKMDEYYINPERKLRYRNRGFRGCDLKASFIFLCRKGQQVCRRSYA